ncbi:hypothetical protein [Aestuariicoccus sp. MJ-SS9]|uniref:hypothetical protein n=1 Tax=Aestuariicoccus sp. MJ-SS9 TaxID=3079855 RepID=UPI002906467F|nr:hypothetical protein [Aestuariicoccus sp. MJ-SS9]MDU8910891.1 hypothetical protein [Aestuariicoccus sp. MJ-SS9]
MKGWHIFTHSVRLVLNNLGAALRVSLVLYLVQVANQLYVFANPPVMTDLGGGMEMPMMDPGAMVVNLILGLLAVVASLWIAVAWHRFVLAEEYPTGWLPQWHGSYMMAYLGRSILIALMVVLAVIVASVPAGLIAAGLAPLGAAVSLGIVGLAAYVFFRLGVMLPAAALGRKLTLGEAWDATKGESGTILTLALIVIGASVVIQLPSWLNGDPTSVINLIYGLVVSWFATVIGISVLTTLYGHFVEGRSID